ncbi:hypothetical protein [Caminibacter pacificus]|uniref:Uncharacterized protein n=1 Tax=Caminibacter pacificus TaxID=1424653 RepID=A0AAJ4RB68_9BACT|nr:hypothetical protein [Caminibacter pacificus]QDD68145.1 hypothetical protein C6V80_09840 [Caminibacter pacificus]ROR38763.1 hypothetical protein EDC58_1978 [Caminibacter pacificus]
MRKVLTLLITAVTIFAYDLTQQNQNQVQQNNQVVDSSYGISIPYFSSPAPKYVQRKRFELNTDTLNKLYKQIYKKYQKRSRILTNTFDISILMKPATKFIKPVDLIYVNPQYITQLIFPKGFKITSAIAGFPTNVFIYAGNELHFRVKRDFVNGNMIVYLTDGRRNLSINILVENYIQKDCKKIKGTLYCIDSKKYREPLYKYAYSNYSLVYKFIDRKPLNPLKVIYLYSKLTGKPLNIKKDGDYVTFVYKDITYFIYRNDKFGDIFFKGKKYIVKP